MSTNALLPPTICPSCHRQELYISPRDARVVQCFGCGLRQLVNPNNNDLLNEAMERLYVCLHTALMETPHVAPYVL